MWPYFLEESLNSEKLFQVTILLRQYQNMGCFAFMSLPFLKKRTHDLFITLQLRIEKSMSDILYLVIPCYNEEEALSANGLIVIDIMNEMISRKLIRDDSKILFVDDGSTDKTWQKIRKLRDENPIVTGVKLSRNYGHQNALYAGLIEACKHADVTISMDADLQDDIDCLIEFMKKYYEGCDIVYGVRRDRSVDTKYKRWTADVYYKIAKSLDHGIIYNHADYRLMSKKAVNSLSYFKEYHLFLRGIIPMLGYKTGIVEYTRKERFVGDSKYNLKKMCILAWDGIFAISIMPLKMIIRTGLVISVISFAHLIVLLSTTSSSLITPIIGMATGINLFALGIIGEYIGRIFDEVKQRPRYIIEETLNCNSTEKIEMTDDGCCRNIDNIL